MKWWRSFTDPAGRERLQAIGPRRRGDARYPYQLELRARAHSWAQPKRVELHDVSAGGLYLLTEEPAALGERLDVELKLKDGTLFVMAGEIVSVVSPDEAVQVGRWPGLGIKLDPLPAETAWLFDRVLEEARAAAPGFAAETSGNPAPTGSSSPSGSMKIPAALRASRESQKTPLPTPSPRSAHGAPRPTNGVVAIDLGNDHFTLSALVDKRVAILARLDGVKSIPAVVTFPSTGAKPLAGVKARPYADRDPSHTVVAPKRLLGRRYDDPAIQDILAQAAWRAAPAPDGTIVIDMWGEPISIPKLVSLLFVEARDIAEEVLGEKVGRAVLTVPIMWEEEALKALRQAAEMAGLEVAAVVDEPTAAAWSHRTAPGFEGLIGVFDFGGTETRFAVVDVSRGDFQVVAAAGDDRLGGDHLDEALAEVVAEQFWTSSKVDLRAQGHEWRRLLHACEKAKRQLIWTDPAVLSVQGVLKTEKGVMDLHTRIDRATLVAASRSFVERAVALCQETLGLCGLASGQLSTVILAGGTNHLPVVWQALQYALQTPVVSIVPPELTVCLGAGMHAAQRQLLGAPTGD